MFIGIVGKTFRSDIAIDDIILNPDCLTNSTRVFPTSVPTCRKDQFKCVIGGQCISNTTRCDKKKNCRDGSDEVGCSDGGNTGKQTGGISKGTSIIAAGAVGGLVVLLIIVLVAYIIVKRKREKNSTYSLYFMIQPSNQKKERRLGKSFVYFCSSIFTLRSIHICFSGLLTLH